MLCKYIGSAGRKNLCNLGGPCRLFFLQQNTPYHTGGAVRYLSTHEAQGSLNRLLLRGVLDRTALRDIAFLERVFYCVQEMAGNAVAGLCYDSADAHSPRLSDKSLTIVGGEHYHSRTRSSPCDFSRHLKSVHARHHGNGCSGKPGTLEEEATHNCRRSETKSPIQRAAFSLLESVAEGGIHGESVTHSESVTSNASRYTLSGRLDAAIMALRRRNTSSGPGAIRA